MYLDDDNWNLNLEVENKKNSEDNLNDSLFIVHNNIIQTCLLVEGIGNMATTLEQNFRPFLFKALYFILERAGKYYYN